MKLLMITLLLGACCTSTAYSQAFWTPANMIHYKRVSSPVISNDGRWVAYVVATPRVEGEKSDLLSQIYLVATDSQQGRQLTSGDRSCNNPRFSPNGQFLSFTSGRASDGRIQLYQIRLADGETTAITAQKGNVGPYRWSPDSQHIAFTMSDPPTAQEEKQRREREDWEVVDGFRNAHLYSVSLAKEQGNQYPVNQLTKGDFHVTSFDWSPDSKTLVFSHQPQSWPELWDRQDISSVAAQGGAIRQLVSTPGADTGPIYSPDGESIVFLSEGGKPDPINQVVVTTGVYSIPATGGEARKLARTPDERSTLLGWTPDSHSVVVSEALGTRTGLYLLPLSGQSPQSVPVPNTGIQQDHFLNAKGDLVYVYQATEMPVEVYMASLGTPTGRKLTDVHADYAPNQPLARTQLINWQAKDGKFTIESLLTYPANYQAGQRYPLLVMIHGGPLGNWSQAYTGANYAPGVSGPGAPFPIQAFAQQGYFVLWPNPRGSGGYGHGFRAAAYRDWSDGPYQDIMAGVDKVISMGMAHADSLVVSGWSYGGYLTAMSITKTARFKAAMAGAAVTNLMSDVGTTDIPYYARGYFGKDYWDDPKIYADQSPLFHIKKAKTPTLIIHGQADTRVAPEQSYQLYRALQRLGVPAQMVTYPRQYHSFSEPKFVQNAGERSLEWFNRYLGRKGVPVFK